ncbi:probable C-mannosyltransferase DPY19L2 isoform X1 [Heterocephalus glaber]|uniref:Probable C-mannosyltransferase DPY19L2 isoform X1 n=1 Tax=Heterocephalus glaber TaxID=10181 RepID=A0AAX6SKM5_HETGA|nr:probable C-mannosyltransferase DPY19L2 isoform X1 [Heterocephalus glaber]
MITNDRLTEYPLVINTVKRFHLYPEVILAYWYRTVTGITNLFGVETKTCWNVTSVGLPSEVESCEGLGDPACFYVGVIFILNGLMMGLFFIYATYLSGSHLGGLITVLCYFFNHGEATRVMWAPPLRESFACPFLVLQMYILTMILRSSNNYGKHYIALCLANVAFMLPWEFAQFILFTQTASLFTMYVVGYIQPSKFQKIIYMNMVSVILCFILMFGNPVYLSSYYSSSLLMTWVIILKRNEIHRMGICELNFWAVVIPGYTVSRQDAPGSPCGCLAQSWNQPWVLVVENGGFLMASLPLCFFEMLIQGCAWWFGTIILKLLTAEILGVSDHISLTDLIAARILRYTDFDTLMYTCAPETYFMEQATPLRYIKTLLLPVVMTIRDVFCALSTNTYLRKQLLEHGELVFHALQLLAFAALAILILRLKLFLTPHMCVMASLICSQRLFGWLFRRFHFESVIFGILTVMSIQGCANLRNQWSIRGEFTNLPQEELLQWIKYNTRPDAVFAGTMQTMASIKLSTLHPIVNHPHYEDADLRARTKIAYSVYSRKSAKEVRNKLLALHVNYYVLEESWCIWKTKPGCSMLEIWDLEDPSNSANPSLCSTLLRDARPYFTIVFQNTLYRVLKVNRERDYTSIL